MFGADSRIRIAVTASSSTSADSVTQSREQINHAKSQVNVVLKP